MYERQHSPLGIASLLLSLLCGLVMFVALLVGGILADEPDTPAQDAFFGITFLIVLFGTPLALGLGIGGLFQEAESKLCATLGIVFSSAILLGLMMLLFIILLMPEEAY